MNKKDKVDQRGRLQIKLAFGHAEHLEAFKTQDEACAYLEHDALAFSQEGTPSEPKVVRKGKEIRDYTSKVAPEVQDWLNDMYKTSGHKLENGMLIDHRDIIQGIIVNDIQAKDQASKYRQYIDNGKLLTDEDTQELIDKVAEHHKHRLPEGKIPETGAYPPYDPERVTLPPTYQEWKRKQKKSSSSSSTYKSPFAELLQFVRPAQLCPNVTSQAQALVSPLQQNNNNTLTFPHRNNNINNNTSSSTTTQNKLIYLTFKNHEPNIPGGRHEEFGVPIIGNLNRNSTMNEVLKEAEFVDNLGVVRREEHFCKFLIKKTYESNDYILYKFFIQMTVQDIISTPSVDSPYTIIVDKQIFLTNTLATDNDE